jgi:hypothetical protein
MRDAPTRVGDVVLDLAQGRPMLVTDQAADTVAAWHETHDYDLLGNYGNDRLGATERDTVWTCVYVGSIRSEPSKTYDFPSSRLARIEHEAATDGERVQDVIAEHVLTGLMDAAADVGGGPAPVTVEQLARDASVPERVIEAAQATHELHQADAGGDDA